MIDKSKMYVAKLREIAHAVDSALATMEDGTMYSVLEWRDDEPPEDTPLLVCVAKRIQKGYFKRLSSAAMRLHLYETSSIVYEDTKGSKYPLWAYLPEMPLTK